MSLRLVACCRVEKALRKVPGVTVGLGEPGDRDRTQSCCWTAPRHAARRAGGRGATRPATRPMPTPADSARRRRRGADSEAARAAGRCWPSRALLCAAAGSCRCSRCCGGATARCCPPPGSWALATPVQFVARRALLRGNGWHALRAGSRQHGLAGGAGHQSAAYRPVAVWQLLWGHASPWRSPPLLRGVGGRHHAGAARQVAGGPRQAPDHGRGDPRAGRRCGPRRRACCAHGVGGRSCRSDGAGARAISCVVRPGERLPVDGVVIEEGASHGRRIAASPARACRWRKRRRRGA